MNTPITIEELDSMAGEVLPDRTVLSVGATMLSACTTTTTYFQPGAEGLLGLSTNNTPVTTVTCTPGAVATY